MSLCDSHRVGLRYVTVTSFPSHVVGGAADYFWSDCCLARGSAQDGYDLGVGPPAWGASARYCLGEHSSFKVSLHFGQAFHKEVTAGAQGVRPDQVG